jgi:hypothetical protein
VAKNTDLVSREAVVNRIREAGFTFKRQADRVEIWKKRGATTRVNIARRDLLDPVYVATVLRQAGLSETEIAAFFQQVRL